MDHKQKNNMTERARGLVTNKQRKKREKKKRGDSKGESNDSPEIPDMGMIAVKGVSSSIFHRLRNLAVNNSQQLQSLFCGSFFYPHFPYIYIFQPL